MILLLCWVGSSQRIVPFVLGISSLNWLFTLMWKSLRFILPYCLILLMFPVLRDFIQEIFKYTSFLMCLLPFPPAPSYYWGLNVCLWAILSWFMYTMSTNVEMWFHSSVHIHLLVPWPLGHFYQNKFVVHSWISLGTLC